MNSDTKSPFRQWLDNEGLDSQESFNLPSPRLVEKSDKSTPELLFYEVEQDCSETLREESVSSAWDDSRSTQTPAYPVLKPLNPPKVPVSPECSSRRSKGDIVSPLRCELSAHHTEHKTPRRRGLSPSYILSSQLTMKRQLKVDVGKRTEGAVALHLTCMKKKVAVKTLPPGVTMYGVPFGISSPKAMTVKSRPPESPRGAGRANKDTTMGNPYRTPPNHRKLMETVTRVLSPKSRPSLHPCSPLKPRPSKSSIRKFGRSLTPLERCGLRRF